MPFALTADERTAIETAARPIPRDQRDAFMKAVRAALATVPERGPGIVHRVIREAQRQFRGAAAVPFDPPSMG
jgi:hypothetical protein